MPGRLAALAQQLEPKAAIATQRQQLWSIDGVPGYWKQVSAPKRAAAITKEYDGGSDVPENMSAPPEIDNLTLTRGYRPIHAAHVKTMWDGVGRLRVNVHCHDVDADGNVIEGSANSRSYPNALVASTTRPDTDWGSGAAANWVVELAVGREV